MRVFQAEAGDTLELLGVARDEDTVVGEGGDEEIVGADGRAGAFE